jgi:hypothetical protein
MINPCASSFEPPNVMHAMRGGSYRLMRPSFWSVRPPAVFLRFYLPYSRPFSSPRVYPGLCLDRVVAYEIHPLRYLTSSIPLLADPKGLQSHPSHPSRNSVRQTGSRGTSSRVHPSPLPSNPVHFLTFRVGFVSHCHLPATY